MNRVRALTGQSIATPLPDWIGGLPFARHAREYTFPEARVLMERAGLTVVYETSRHFHRDTGRSSLAGRTAKTALDRVAQLRPTLGPSIIMLAQRPAGTPAAATG